MGFSEKVSNIYTSLEDKYFNVLDALDHRGVPVYAYSDFFEDKGIPSFIVTITIIIAILILLSVAFGPNTNASGEITLNIKDAATGQGIQNVKLSIFSIDGTPIQNEITVGDGSIVKIPAMPVGTRLNLTAQKDGYQPTNESIILGQERKVGNLYFEKDLIGIEAKVRLTDDETKTKVTSANVFVRYNNLEYTFFLDNNGIFKNTSIPQGVSVLLRVSAEGYTLVEENVVFNQNLIKDITLKPDGSAYSGKATLLISVSNELANSINDAKVTIYNRETGVILLDDITSDGVVSGSIQTGIPLRITIEKEGYITYDSEKDGEAITLRRAEERIDRTLKMGGESLIVNVVNQLGLPLTGAVVQIYDSENLKLASKITTATGVEFNGLQPSSEIIITAYKDGFLANRKKINPSQEESTVIVLTDAVSINSTRLDVFTIDAFATSIPAAKLKVFIISEDGNTLPYGLDEIETNIAGFKDIIVEKSKTYQIIAETQIMYGVTNVEVLEEVYDTKVYIKMEKKANVIELNLKDIYGNLINGEARISGLDGTILFDGLIENGKIFFNAENRKIVDLEVRKDDGNVFKTNVTITGKNVIDVIVYEKGSSELAPEIEFIGIETENGDSVSGITPGAFYFINFKVSFPIASDEAGVHIRTGLDSSEFASEDNVALFSLEMTDAITNYSYSFTKDPAPGNEVVDRSNQGFSEEANKWGEALIQNPSGTYTLKAKIRVAEFTGGKIPIHYRAWSKIQNDFYRTPSDEILGLDAQVEEKSGLYANTQTQDIVVYESLPECSDDLCVTMNFVDDEENYYDTLGFEALTGEIYGIEAEFTSVAGDFLQVTIESDSNLVFLGTQTGTIGFTNRSNNAEKNEASTTVNITPNGKQKVRFYFRADTPGAKVIFFNALGKNEIIKEISFNSVIEKELIIELSENNIILGRNFTVRVLDQGLAGINNALIKILDKEGSVVKSIIGNNTEGVGANGNYRVENNLLVGLYTVEVSVPKYKTKTESLLISTTQVLSFTENIDAKMLFNEKQKVVTAELKNNSEFSISDLSYEISESENFRVTTFLPPLISKTSNQTIQLTIEYIGTDETADEVLDITIRGMIEGSFLASTSGKINATYNKKLDSSCLSITPTSLTMNLIGRAGASDSDLIEVTNNCDQAIYLTKRISKDPSKGQMQLQVEDISLQAGETRNLTITATNFVERQFARNETFSYEIIWDSNYLTKRLNVSVNLINPSIALSYPGQITLFLAQDSPQRKAIAAQPIFVTNVSQFPVEGLRFSIDKDYGSSLSLSIEPNTPTTLDKGQSIIPTRILFAESNSKFTEPVRAKVLIEGQVGKINNRVGTRDNYNAGQFLNGTTNIANYNSSSNGYSTGQEILGVIDVEIHYSGLDCLKASLVGDNTFNLSAEGAQRSTQISLQNTCAEPVRIIGGEAASREVIIGIPTLIVSPGQNLHVPMSILSLNPNTRLERHPITVRGITEISQTPIVSTKINVNIFAGVNFSDEYSKATSGIQVNVCNENEKATISTPISSTGTNCSEGYCDALQAAEYLAKKLDLTIKKARSQAYSAQKDIDSLACGTQGFCTFGQLGIQQEEVALYFKNDDLSIGALREEFLKLTSNTSTGFTGQSTDYLIRKEAVGDNIIQFIASTGFGRQIFIDQQLQGCGYYSVTVNGAFPHNPSGVEFESPVVVLRVTQKVDTKECKQSIENLINFIPVDKGYVIGNDRGTLATTVNAENNLQELGKEIAKNLFGENRFGNGNGNKISIKEGAVAGALAEICIGGSSTKKDITVTVNANSNLTGEARKAFDAQIVKMVNEVSNGNFGNNCLVRSSSGYSCVKLTDPADVGGLKIDLAQRTLFFSKTNSCIEATIKSNVEEGVYFDVIPKEEANKKFVGVRKITIQDINSGEEYYSKEFIGGQRAIVGNDKEIFLQQSNSFSDAAYERKVKICATPGEFATASHSEGAYFSANGVQFSIKAINKNSGNAEGKESEVITISTGTLHPDDWLNIFFKEKTMIEKRGVENPYYFTVMWDGEPNNFSLKDYDNDLRRLGLNAEYLKVESDTKALANTGAVRTNRSVAKTEAMNKYFAWCTGTALACNTAYGGVVNGAVSAVLDCGIPAATMMKGELIESYDWANTLWNSQIFKTLSGLSVVGGMFKATDSTVSPQDFSPVMIGVQSGLGGTVGGIERIMSAMGDISKFNASGASNYISDQLVVDFEKEAKKVLQKLDVPAADIDNYASEYATQYRNTVQEKLEAKLKQNLTNSGPTGKLKNPVISRKTLSDKEVQKIVADAVKESEPNLGKFLQTKGFIGDTLTPAMKNALPGLKLGNTAGEVEAAIKQKLQAYAGQPVTINKYDPVNPKKIISTRQITPINNPAATARNVADDIVEELIRGKTVDPNLVSQLKADLARGIRSLPGETYGDIDSISNTMSNKFRAAINKVDPTTGNKVYDDIFKLSTAQMDEVANAIKGIDGSGAKAAGKVDDALKSRTITTKLKELFKSPRFYTSLGFGIACGALSNYVGLKAYNETLIDVEKEQISKASEGLNIELYKGETYRVILAKDSEGPLKADYQAVTGNPTLEEEMRTKLSTNAQGNVDGTFLVWKPELNQSPPEKRPLTKILMQTDLDKLAEKLISDGMHTKDAENIINELKRSSVQQLIHHYSSGIDTTDNSRKLSYEGFNIPEGWIGSLAIMLDGYTFVDQENEAKGNGTKLKDAVLNLARIAKEKNGESMMINDIVASEIFSNKEKADKFVRLNAAWATFLVIDTPTN